MTFKDIELCTPLHVSSNFTTPDTVISNLHLGLKRVDVLRTCTKLESAAWSL